MITIESFIKKRSRVGKVKKEINWMLAIGSIIGLIILLTTQGCKKGGGILGGVDSKMSLKEIGMDILKDIRISSSTVKGIDQVNGILVSSMTVSTPVTIKILERYDQPAIKVDELTVYRSDKIPDTMRITKNTKRYNRGKIEVIQEEIYEPVKDKLPEYKQSNTLIAVIIVQTIALLWVLRKIKRIEKKQT